MKEDGKAKDLKKFFSYYKPYGKLLAADLICSAFVAVIALVLPACVRHITRDVLEAGLENALEAILNTGALMLLLILAQTAFAVFYDYKGHDMGAKIERDMRVELFAHFQKLPFGFYDNQKTGALMSRLTSDLLNLAELYHHGPENIVVYGAQFVGALVLLLHINVKLTLAVCVFLPVMAVYSFVFYGKLRKAYSANRESIAEVNAHTEENLSGIRVVKSFVNEALEIRKFGAANDRFYRSRSNIYKREALHFTIIDKLLTQLITISIIVFGEILIDGAQLAPADLLVFVMYAAYLTAPVPKLAFMVQQYQEGLSGYRRFREIIDTKPDIGDAENALEFGRVEGGVEFTNVAFRYSEDQEYVLRGVDLKVTPGEKIALVGFSGVGKTTMCCLIPRFYEVLEGAVKIDGVDVRDVTLASLRRNIGVVQQESLLFVGTVMENILYGKPDAPEHEAIEAAKKANAHEFISRLPDGYYTNVGHRGVKLSGGQKQRICIARVFLKNPPILIFDEATSNLDYESEKIVMESLDFLAEGRTSFIIAHRLSTVRNAGRIVVLTNSGIAEQGGHDELIKRDGVYAKLYRMQDN